jgi:hypothetical protein
MLDELRGLQTRMEAAQSGALAGDETLRSHQERVREFMSATAFRMFPDLEVGMARLAYLRSAALAAEQAGDRATYEAIAREGREIQAEVETAHARAAEQPEVAREIEAFQAALVAGMRALDPGIEDVLARIQTLATRLAAWLG